MSDHAGCELKMVGCGAANMIPAQTMSEAPRNSAPVVSEKAIRRKRLRNLSI
jgi:hypothetical protein